MDDEARTLLLGTIKLTKDGFRFEPAATVPLALRARERFALIVAYDYEEPTHEKDDVTLRLEADLEGHPLGMDEEVIEDSPALVDDARGHLRVEGATRSIGRVAGRYRIEATHTITPWETDGREARTRKLKHEAEFSLDVT